MEKLFEAVRAISPCKIRPTRKGYTLKPNHSLHEIVQELQGWAVHVQVEAPLIRITPLDVVPAMGPQHCEAAAKVGRDIMKAAADAGEDSQLTFSKTENDLIAIRCRELSEATRHRLEGSGVSFEGFRTSPMVLVHALEDAEGLTPVVRSTTPDTWTVVASVLEAFPQAQVRINSAGVVHVSRLTSGNLDRLPDLVQRWSSDLGFNEKVKISTFEVLGLHAIKFQTVTGLHVDSEGRKQRDQEQRARAHLDDLTDAYPKGRAEMCQIRAAQVIGYPTGDVKALTRSGRILMYWVNYVAFVGASEIPECGHEEARLLAAALMLQATASTPNERLLPALMEFACA